MSDDNAGLGAVFLAIFVAFVASGLALIIVGEVLRRRKVGLGAWAMLAVGALILLVPATALIFPSVLG